MSPLDFWLHDGWLRADDHAFAVALAWLPPDDDAQVPLAAALASRALAFGHGALPLREVAALCAEIDATRPSPPLPGVDDWLAALRASPWVDADPPAGTRPGDDGAPLVLVGDRLWLRRHFAFECAVAADLRARAGARPAPPVDGAAVDATLHALFPGLVDDPDDRQAAAARALLHERLLLLTGGPGTGKTTTVARALALLVQADDAMTEAGPAGASTAAGRAGPRIALAAPTGKAATRLAESLRDQVRALVATGALSPAHADRLPSDAATLHRLLGWRRSNAPSRDDAPRLDVDLLVVDEASMIDLPMMARLLDALPPQARLLLVGDPDQLPSVDTGDVLAALAASSLPQVRLQRVHRQRDDVAIGRLASHVRDGDADAVVDGLAHDAFAGVALRGGDDRRLVAEVLAQALPAYRAVRAAATPEDALRLARDFRVLTALREGPSGSTELNARIADALQPGQPAGRGFDGLLLMITANSARHGLFNGDVGVMRVDADGDARVWFDGVDGPRSWPPSALPKHEPAYALTVHKAQGSEFDRVLLVLPEASSRVLSRELLYTGLTRAKTALTLWAREPILREAIARRVARWSGLAARLPGPASNG